MNSVHEYMDKSMQELRRGTITIGVLSQLSTPQYGYSLVTILKEKGFDVEPGTLYPLLRRLEKQGLLESHWDTNETRPRKYYLLSENGNEAFHLLRTEWQHIVTNMDYLLNGGDDKNGND
ncbi:PadR family transcriptional regulator [Priestia taiwanensis]|uniref:PadR family transcriptional regulator n=1 Tax=Priestia taiwanensis TaxID=1347902 RepID=A0A917AP21_9BACI|nr:PadR family transcriptional regulator [Priestia taiwanensis]MBM7362548.1 DNA-binding PadR family transcriptional regulator [Priestia taiwanensis]GGE63134.1 PadR family transcriptional regulator [Priestia taiwanensis]